MLSSGIMASMFHLYLLSICSRVFSFLNSFIASISIYFNCVILYNIKVDYSIMERTIKRWTTDLSVFDSGLGGLTCIPYLMKELPEEK